MNRGTQIRALSTCVLLAGCFTVFSARLVEIQVVRHCAYARRAAAAHVKRQTLHARRGLITDIHGEVLAQNEPVKTVIANASWIEDREAMTKLAAFLAKPLGLSPDQLMVKLSARVYSPKFRREEADPYITLQHNVPQSVADDVAAQLKTDKIKAISFEQEARRIYPNGHLLCHVLGFVNDQDTGLDGVELTMEKTLRGRDGFRYIEIDGARKEIMPYRGQEHSAEDGHNIRLTIDMGLQNIVEQELDAVVKQWRPKGATVIMMNPKTGEILALANRPNFDLNAKKRDIDTANRLNRAISAQVEPGSTFKIVTFAGALNEGKITPESYFDCERGYWAWCDLHDTHQLGDITANDVLVHSSNIGVAKIAIRLGDQKFYEYAHRFGYGEQTGVALPGEISGSIPPPYKWVNRSITRMPMGQSVTATPLQIATAMGVIANGGSLMMPQIFHEITDEKGRVVTSYPPREVRRVVSKKVTEQVKAALIDVASDKGTAKLARVPGYTVAGKTGTAEKVEKGAYAKDKFVCSFVGFMPAEDPAFVLLVLIDEAQASASENYGGTLAAPVFSRIALRAASYLGLTPTVAEPVVAKVGREGRNFRAP